MPRCTDTSVMPTTHCEANPEWPGTTLQHDQLCLQTASEASELLSSLFVMHSDGPHQLLQALRSFQEHCTKPGILVIDGLGPMLQELRSGNSQHKQGGLQNHGPPLIATPGDMHAALATDLPICGKTVVTRRFELSLIHISEPTRPY